MVDLLLYVERPDALPKPTLRNCERASHGDSSHGECGFGIRESRGAVLEHGERRAHAGQTLAHARGRRCRVERAAAAVAPGTVRCGQHERQQGRDADGQ
ncbi:MAG: hypothetical protein ABR583_12900 [Gaiellaceae bacterium]